MRDPECRQRADRCQWNGEERDERRAVTIVEGDDYEEHEEDRKRQRREQREQRLIEQVLLTECCWLQRHRTWKVHCAKTILKCGYDVGELVAGRYVRSEE